MAHSDEPDIINRDMPDISDMLDRLGKLDTPDIINRDMLDRSDMLRLLAEI